MALAADPEVDVVVELIGGSEGVARDLVEAALGERQARRHRQQGAAGASTATSWRHWPSARACALAFEAAVAGGIPVIKGLREGLAANAIKRRPRHPERHLQLHPDRDAGDRARVRRRAGRSAEAGLRRSRSELRHRRHRRRAQAGDPDVRRLRLPGRFRRGLCRGHPAHLRPGYRTTPGSSATGSSFSASPGATMAGSSSASIPAMVPVDSPIARGRWRVQRGRGGRRFRRKGDCSSAVAPGLGRPLGRRRRPAGRGAGPDYAGFRRPIRATRADSRGPAGGTPRRLLHAPYGASTAPA